MMDDKEFEELFADDSQPDSKTLEKTLKSAKSSVGQQDTLMFAFVNIWVAMAALLAPMFAKIAIKNSESLKPQSSHTPKTTDLSNSPAKPIQKTPTQNKDGDKHA